MSARVKHETAMVTHDDASHRRHRRYVSSSSPRRVKASLFMLCSRTRSMHAFEHYFFTSFSRGESIASITAANVSSTSDAVVAGTETFTNTPPFLVFASALISTLLSPSASCCTMHEDHGYSGYTVPKKPATGTASFSPPPVPPFMFNDQNGKGQLLMKQSWRCAAATAESTCDFTDALFCARSVRRTADALSFSGALHSAMEARIDDAMFACQKPRKVSLGLSFIFATMRKHR